MRAPIKLTCDLKGQLYISLQYFYRNLTNPGLKQSHIEYKESNLEEQKFEEQVMDINFLVMFPSSNAWRSIVGHNWWWHMECAQHAAQIRQDGVLKITFPCGGKVLANTTN